MPASGQWTAKPIAIKDTGGKSGGCAWKAIELTSGDFRLVVKTRLRMERFMLTGREKSAKGEVLTKGEEGRNGPPPGG